MKNHSEPKIDDKLLPHPEIEERSWPAIIGLALAVLGCVALFVLPKTSEKGLIIQMISIIATSLVSGLLCYFGIRKSPIIALVGMAVALLLLVTMVCGLIGTLATC